MPSFRSKAFATAKGIPTIQTKFHTDRKFAMLVANVSAAIKAATNAT